jgi:hypothetical protein
MPDDTLWDRAEIAPELLIYGPGEQVRRLKDVGADEEIHKCSQCDKRKIASEFTSGYTWCKSCWAAYQRERRDDPEIRATHQEQGRARYAANPDAQRNRRLMSQFGITLEQYNAIKAAQGGVCAICGEPETAVLKGNGERSDRALDLAIDHDHQHDDQHPPTRVACPECIRGLLCRDCNVNLGRIGDSVEWLKSALAHLQKPVRWRDAF